jgi:transcriptional regulator with XRE-family HTH domain
MSQFPNILKTWRNARRLSQLDLALQANISARHISFLETGRARPSRDMVARLGDALQLPLATRNQMLTDAGFAPRYPNRNWDDAEMAPIHAAIDHMLTTHAPYPAIAIDRRWTVFKMNEPAEKLFGLLGIAIGTSLIDVITSDQIAAFVENWPDVARHAAQRLRTESAAQGGVSEFDRAVETPMRQTSKPSSQRSTAPPTCGSRFLQRSHNLERPKIWRWMISRSRCFSLLMPRPRLYCAGEPGLEVAPIASPLHPLAMKPGTRQRHAHITGPKP